MVFVLLSGRTPSVGTSERPSVADHGCVPVFMLGRNSAQSVSTWEHLSAANNRCVPVLISGCHTAHRLSVLRRICQPSTPQTSVDTANFRIRASVSSLALSNVRGLRESPYSSVRVLIRTLKRPWAARIFVSQRPCLDPHSQTSVAAANLHIPASMS